MSVLHVLQHALGRDEFGRRRRGATSDYRNHYCASEGHYEWTSLREAVSSGLMVERPPSPISGGDTVFIVTAAGVEYVDSHSPEPPKISRSKARYRAYLDASDLTGETFGEYLRSGRAS